MMDPNAVVVPDEHPGVCPVCHMPVSPTYYFCPNCGAKVHEPPLSISPLAQLGLYAFSIILPMICYLLISKWPGITYVRSKDEKIRQVGAIACGLLVLSSVATFYYAYVWTEEALQQATAQINQENQDQGELGL
jgi:hypothetical protein